MRTTRNKEIYNLYKSGKTMEEIGKIFNFSRSRAQQIIVKEIKKDILDRLKNKNLSTEELVLLDIAAKEEIRDMAIKRKEKDDQKNIQRIKEKIAGSPYANFFGLSTYAKTLKEDPVLIKKYFPEVVRYITRKRLKSWSRYYNKCRICGTTAIKHASHGLCEKCYPKSDIFKDMQEASRLRNMHKWKKKQKIYAREYAKRPEVIAKMKKKEDERRYGGNREKAIKRDNFKCQKCGLSRDESKKRLGRDLFVYHLGNNKNNELDNLVTLCQRCFNKKTVKLMWKSRL